MKKDDFNFYLQTPKSVLEFVSPKIRATLSRKAHSLRALGQAEWLKFPETKLPLDSELIDRARLGHPHAQEMLLRTLSPRLLNLVHRLGCDPSTGEELVSEALYKGLVKLHKLKKDQAILPWFQRILVNLFRDYLRKKKPKDTFLEDVQEPQAPLQDQPIPRLEAEELKDKLSEAISRLPTRQRVTLSLHYECELNQSEIAEVLDTTLESVKMNLHHARKRLMNLLSKDSPEDVRKNPPNESTKC